MTSTCYIIPASSLLLTTTLLAAPLGPTQCLEVTGDAERLACYDAAMSRVQPEPETATVPLASKTASEQGEPTPGPSRRAAGHSMLDTAWELEPSSKLGTFIMRSFRPTYILPVFYTPTPNSSPINNSSTPSIGTSDRLQRTEAKFQISLKTKLVQNLFKDNGDIWLGYTQTSRWQVYNRELSRPFHETNYEPEAALVLRTNYDLLGWHGRLLSLSLNHQSNGRSQPLSRSWNRVIAGVGLEKGGWSVVFRPWWRIPESTNDDNPGIENYIGRGSVTVMRQEGDHALTLTARHSFRFGNASRGSVQAEWGFPIKGNLKGYVQLFSGYGESLIDYNYRNNYIGLGFSLIDGY
ncbi:phospholipase A [Chitinimonas sp. BJB300]|uniref:phospholipase A n=1 Tax=Chitinimonas sp. BJB300 TaxID=1559339 RepID=UPI000C10695B|nr:phospholipase A [Chitinimonas sp. BJB300]PHV10742.1 phospholipase [Chitinimonas sp. BJB300]TSJ91242.1 phospholipase [Chitinimonas sp. BJB300]